MTISAGRYQNTSRSLKTWALLLSMSATDSLTGREGRYDVNF